MTVLTAFDKKIAVIILLVALVMMAGVLYRRVVTPPGQQSVILVDNRVVTTVVLAPNAEKRDFMVQGVRGESVIRVEGSYISIVSSACPDQLCIKMGRKSRPGEVIVCLPNRVVVRIEGNEH